MAQDAEKDGKAVWANTEDVKREYDLSLTPSPQENHYDAAIICVTHHQFKDMGIGAIKKLCKTNHIIFDVKYLFDKSDVDDRL